MQIENVFLDLFEALFSVLGKLVEVFLPLIIGLCLSYLLDSPVSWLEGKTKSRGLAILLTYLGVAAAFAALIYAFVILILGAFPKGGIAETFASVRDYCDNALRAADDFLAAYMPASAADEPKFSLRELQSSFVTKFSPANVISAAYSLVDAIFSFFVGFVASVYLLKDKALFTGLVEKLLSLSLNQKTHGIVCEIAADINKVLSTFIRGAVIDSLFVAFLSSLVLSILKLDYSVIIGIIAGMLNIIPYFGPFFGMVPAFLLAFFSKGLFYALAAVCAMFIVQQIDSNYIYPKVVGEATGLHPLFVLLSVSIMGYFLGVFGMLLAVPIAGIIQIFIRRTAYGNSK